MSEVINSTPTSILDELVHCIGQTCKTKRRWWVDTVHANTPSLLGRSRIRGGGSKGNLGILLECLIRDTILKSSAEGRRDSSLQRCEHP